ncbi:hypothetical protein E4U53_002384 [Claviceps sorghi]|nr:hypothetical protein E4U53_002384 [Claviceps sorghi]
MSNPAADAAGAAKPATYLDYTSKPDLDSDLIRSTMTSAKFRDSVWGFVIYRCSRNHQPAWERMLHDVRSTVQEGLRFYLCEDLLPFHHLHVIDDPALYGATSHDVRHHFQSWVAEELEARLRPDATDLEADATWLRASSTPRYLYCLFADDICLESMAHPGVNSPVVKILDRNWGPLGPDERNYTVAAPFHDGTTEYLEEDVGWMYMPLADYMWKYEWLARDDWDSMYVRPPYIDGTEEESDMVGHWRKESRAEIEAASEPPL